MKKIWKFVKNKTVRTWNFLDGKKTTIGTVLYVAAKAGQAFAPNLIDPAQYEFVEMVGAGLAGVGLTHKAVKTRVVNDAIKRAQQSFRKK